MTGDVDTLWQSSYETLYDTWYQELASEALLVRWERIDITASGLTGVTASGSAVAGWALWSDPGGKIVWAALAGIASVAAIAHGVLRVASRVKQQEELRRLFGVLRVDLETFRQLLTGLTPTEAAAKYDVLRQRFGQCFAQAHPCIAYTRRLRNRVQSRLNEQLRAKGYME
jgi:hypothetical protein